MRILSVVVLAIGLAVAFMRPFNAQPSTDDGCPSLVHDALSQLDNVCTGLGRNSICYGNTLVSATFAQDVADDVFVEPSDQIALKEIEMVQTAPLDETNNIWGLALMNVQANVPGTLPGQGVVYVLMGDARIENRVDTATLPDPGKTMELTITTRANVRSAPSTRANIIGAVEANTTLKADIRTEDGEWLRVDYNGLHAWINRVVVSSPDEISSLPAPAENNLSPMQAFQFTGGIGATSCSQASGSLLIQGPEKVVVTLEANGARIKLASTILLTRTGNTMRFTTLSGAAKVGNVIVPRGYSTVTDLNADSLVTTFSEPALLTETEIAELGVFEDISSGVLNYQLHTGDFKGEMPDNIGDGHFNVQQNLCAVDPTLGMCNKGGGQGADPGNNDNGNNDNNGNHGDGNNGNGNGNNGQGNGNNGDNGNHGNGNNGNGNHDHGGGNDDDDD